ncbi:MAG: hypothetical protein KF898_06105 [Parachlamydiales bacterium]|nr:hypothetical protein [Verrucomicrobiota bacterium]MBX3719203.1 hypothetical protein [Candidatus Acheromyda pituitae]
MRFALNSDHKDFYSKNGFIEFEDFLDANSVAALQKEIDTTLCARLKTSSIRMAELPRSAIFDSGFDLWRDNATLKHTLFKATFSEIAAQLFQAPLLRIAFDQYLDTGTGSESPLSTSLSLNDLSCANPLSGALILRLSELPVDPCDPQTCPIPSKAGSAIFLSPDKVIPWKDLFSQKDLRLMILAYGFKKTFYRLCKNDPHTHQWKKLGYVFGDLLKDNLHPILFRA